MLLVAHRTPRTAAACRELAQLGATGFETDVQVRPPRDGRSDEPADADVRVSHYLGVGPLGPWLQRDNARLRLGYGPPRDPRLADVLARIPPGCTVLLDPKPREPAARARLAAALAAQLRDRDRFVVSTDRADDLAAYGAAGFRTWLTIKDRAALHRALACDTLAHAGVSVRHTTLDAAAVRALHERVERVVAWTVNDVRRAVQLRELGVDGVTTDSRDVLAELGHR